MPRRPPDCQTASSVWLDTLLGNQAQRAADRQQHADCEHVDHQGPSASRSSLLLNHAAIDHRSVFDRYEP
jgi:hypothetical protein